MKWPGRKPGWKKSLKDFNDINNFTSEIVWQQAARFFTTGSGFLAIPMYTRECLPNKEHSRSQIIFKTP